MCRIKLFVSCDSDSFLLLCTQQVWETSSCCDVNRNGGFWNCFCRLCRNLMVLWLAWNIWFHACSKSQFLVLGFWWWQKAMKSLHSFEMPCWRRRKIDVKLMVFLLFPFDVQNAPCVLPRFGNAALLGLHVHKVFVEPWKVVILLFLVVWCRRKQEICRCKLLGSAKNES